MLASQKLILGALQGISELFPVSSLGQTILLTALLKWEVDAAEFLPFLVALHLATAIALLIYFWKDWKVVVAAFVNGLKRGQPVYDRDSKFAWLLIAGTVVVGLMGLVFEKKLRALFDNPRYAWIVAVILILNGVIMLFADVLKKRAGHPAASAAATDNVLAADPATDIPTERNSATDLTYIEAASIGATQSFALLPGISRSGVTIVAGLLAGLSYEEAGRFSFMLATPVIGLAAILKVPRLLTPDARPELMINLAAAVVAGITAYLSTRFLMRYFRHHRLGPFGWFCIIFGIFSVTMLRLGGTKSDVQPMNPQPASAQWIQPSPRP